MGPLRTRLRIPVPHRHPLRARLNPPQRPSPPSRLQRPSLRPRLSLRASLRPSRSRVLQRRREAAAVPGSHPTGPLLRRSNLPPALLRKGPA